MLLSVSSYLDLRNSRTALSVTNESTYTPFLNLSTTEVCETSKFPELLNVDLIKGRVYLSCSRKSEGQSVSREPFSVHELLIALESFP